MILEAIGYPDLEQHAMEHAQLHQEGLELVEEFMKDSFRVGVVFEYIVNEIVNHILGADKAFLHTQPVRYRRTVLFPVIDSQE